MKLFGICLVLVAATTSARHHNEKHHKSHQEKHALRKMDPASIFPEPTCEAPDHRVAGHCMAVAPGQPPVGCGEDGSGSRPVNDHLVRDGFDPAKCSFCCLAPPPPPSCESPDHRVAGHCMSVDPAQPPVGCGEDGSGSRAVNDHLVREGFDPAQCNFCCLAPPPPRTCESPDHMVKGDCMGVPPGQPPVGCGEDGSGRRAVNDHRIVTGFDPAQCTFCCLDP